MPWIIDEEERERERRLIHLIGRIRSDKETDTPWHKLARDVLNQERCPEGHPDRLALEHHTKKFKLIERNKKEAEVKRRAWKPTNAQFITREEPSPQELPKGRENYLRSHGWRWSQKERHWWAWESEKTKQTVEQSTLLNATTPHAEMATT